MSVLRSGLCTALTDEVIQNLNEKGIRTVTDLIAKDLEEVSHQTKLPYKDLVAIVNVLLAQYSAFPVSGDTLYETVLRSTSILLTGCEGLDKILDGGLYTGEVTEIAGEIASGKTQLCFSITASVISESCQNVLYIDTCGGFSAERLEEILHTKYGLQDLSSTLERTRYIVSHDIYSLLSRLQQLKSSIGQQSDPFYSSVKLLVIDNIASVVYPILGGNQLDGHGLIVQVSQLIKILAVDYSLSVLVMNNVVSSEGERKASLGRMWSYVPHNRLIISSVKDNQRQLMLVKSSRAVTGQVADFLITDKGCIDVG